MRPTTLGSIVILLLALLLAPSPASALPIGVAGTWSGNWLVDTIHSARLNENGTVVIDDFQWINSAWSPSEPYGDGTPSPENPYPFVLVLHEFEGGDWGELHMDPGDLGILSGWVSREPVLDNDVLSIHIDYGPEGLYGDIGLNWNPTPGAVLSGDFNEVSAPPIGYSSWEGGVEMTNTTVPEPGTLALVGVGLAGLARAKGRRKR